MRRIEEQIGNVKHVVIYDEGDQVDHEAFGVDGKIAFFRKRTETGIEETYLVDSKIVTAEKYERARRRFPAMPASNSALDGVGKVVSTAGMTGEPTDEIDDDHSLRDMALGGMTAEEFLNAKGLFGQLSHTGTQKLIEQLEAADGDLTMIDLEVPKLRSEPLLAAGILVRLPTTHKNREVLFKVAAELLDECGFATPKDHGQELLLIRAD